MLAGRQKRVIHRSNTIIIIFFSTVPRQPKLLSYSDIRHFGTASGALCLMEGGALVTSWLLANPPGVTRIIHFHPGSGME